MHNPLLSSLFLALILCYNYLPVADCQNLQIREWLLKPENMTTLSALRTMVDQMVFELQQLSFKLENDLSTAMCPSNDDDLNVPTSELVLALINHMQSKQDFVRVCCTPVTILQTPFGTLDYNLQPKSVDDLVHGSLMISNLYQRVQVFYIKFAFNFLSVMKYAVHDSRGLIQNVLCPDTPKNENAVTSTANLLKKLVNVVNSQAWLYTKAVEEGLLCTDDAKDDTVQSYLAMVLVNELAKNNSVNVVFAPSIGQATNLNRSQLSIVFSTQLETQFNQDYKNDLLSKLPGFHEELCSLLFNTTTKPSNVDATTERANLAQDKNYMNMVTNYPVLPFRDQIAYFPYNIIIEGYFGQWNPAQSNLLVSLISDNGLGGSLPFMMRVESHGINRFNCPQLANCNQVYPESWLESPDLFDYSSNYIVVLCMRWDRISVAVNGRPAFEWMHKQDPQTINRFVIDSPNTIYRVTAQYFPNGYVQQCPAPLDNYLFHNGIRNDPSGGPLQYVRTNFEQDESEYQDETDLAELVVPIPYKLFS